jgi:hypothetical protein
MRNILRRISNAPIRLMALASSAIMVATTADAQAASIGTLADQVKTNFQQIGNFGIAGGFLGGVFMSATGLMKLKAASDDGGQRVKYSEGMWRLGVGACLCGLPAVTGTGVGTFFGSGTGGTAPALGTATFSQ